MYALTNVLINSGVLSITREPTGKYNSVTGYNEKDSKEKINSRYNAYTLTYVYALYRAFTLGIVKPGLL